MAKKTTYTCDRCNFDRLTTGTIRTEAIEQPVDLTGYDELKAENDGHRRALHEIAMTVCPTSEPGDEEFNVPEICKAIMAGAAAMRENAELKRRLKEARDTALEKAAKLLEYRRRTAFGGQNSEDSYTYEIPQNLWPLIVEIRAMKSPAQEPKND